MVTEFGRMAYQWPADTDFSLWELDVLDRNCPVCGRMMHICDHRYRRFHTLDGPVQLICKLNHCPNLACPGHAKTKSPELEITLALPQMAIGWDVFCWIGHRRCSRHTVVSRILGARRNLLIFNNLRKHQNGCQPIQSAVSGTQEWSCPMSESANNFILFDLYCRK